MLRNLLQAIDKKYHVARTTKIEKSNTKASQKSNPSKNNQTSYKAKNKDREPWVDGARPNASSIYVNPNTEKTSKDSPSRKVLKLKPEDIYKQPDK